jgi:type III secretion protein T
MIAVPQIDSYSALTRQALDIVAGFSLCFARVQLMILVLPPITRLGLTGLQKTALSIAIALPVQPLMLEDRALLHLQGLQLMLLIVKEGAVGLALGVAIAVPFWIVETMGELIDQQRASQSAVVQDPGNASPAGITATLFILVLCLMFFQAGGLDHLIAGFLMSYQIWPASQLTPAFGPHSMALFVALFDHVLSAGFTLAGPLLGAMVLGELGLALVSRIAPQLNVFDLSMGMKGIIFVLGMPLTLSIMLTSFREALAPLMHMTQYLRSFVAG